MVAPPSAGRPQGGYLERKAALQAITDTAAGGEFPPPGRAMARGWSPNPRAAGAPITPASAPGIAALRWLA